MTIGRLGYKYTSLFLTNGCVTGDKSEDSIEKQKILSGFMNALSHSPSNYAGFYENKGKYSI